VRVIALDVKSPIFPEVPTFVENGYPEVNLSANIGLLGPKGLPPPVIKTWENTVEVVRKDPEFIAAIKKVGVNANRMMGTDKIRDYFKKGVERFSQFTPGELGWD
jgi:tripartite-type tricarboxylate transporter receptor subunit TctC